MKSLILILCLMMLPFWGVSQDFDFECGCVPEISINLTASKELQTTIECDYPDTYTGRYQVITNETGHQISKQANPSFYKPEGKNYYVSHFIETLALGDWTTYVVFMDENIDHGPIVSNQASWTLDMSILPVPTGTVLHITNTVTLTINN